MEVERVEVAVGDRGGIAVRVAALGGVMMSLVVMMASGAIGSEPSFDEVIEFIQVKIATDGAPNMHEGGDAKDGKYTFKSGGRCSVNLTLEYTRNAQEVFSDGSRRPIRDYLKSSYLIRLQLLDPFKSKVEGQSVYLRTKGNSEIDKAFCYRRLWPEPEPLRCRDDDRTTAVEISFQSDDAAARVARAFDYLIRQCTAKELF